MTAKSTENPVWQISAPQVSRWQTPLQHLLTFLGCRGGWWCLMCLCLHIATTGTLLINTDAKWALANTVLHYNLHHSPKLPAFCALLHSIRSLSKMDWSENFPLRMHVFCISTAGQAEHGGTWSLANVQSQERTASQAPFLTICAFHQSIHVFIHNVLAFSRTPGFLLLCCHVTSVASCVNNGFTLNLINHSYTACLINCDHTVRTDKIKHCCFLIPQS